MGQTRVNSQDIRDGQVSSSDLADDSVTKDKLGIVGQAGDILTYSTEPVALRTGVNGHILTVDNSSATGVAWTSTPVLSAVKDGNGNTLITFVGVGSAVNSFLIANHSTSNAPSISAFGSDTDINIRIIPKGAGKLKLGSLSLDAVDVSSSQSISSKTLTSINLGSSNASTFGTDGRLFPKIATFCLAIDTDATVGTDKTNYIIMPYNATIIKCNAIAKVGPVGSDLIMDINLNGTSIWDINQARRITITDGSTTGSETSFDTVDLLADDYLSIDIDQIGSTTPGQSITVQLTLAMRNQ